jgi:DNA-binding CsgD family transcriptional regulator
MKEKILNEAEILSIKRLKAKKVPYQDIADRIGISIERVKAIYGVRSK